MSPALASFPWARLALVQRVYHQLATHRTVTSASHPATSTPMAPVSSLAFAIPLLGPPEIYHRPPPSSATLPASDHPFIDLMDAKFNSVTLPSPPPMGLTENLSPTFVSSGDPCLDFFFQVVPSTPAATVVGLLASAWEQDAVTALKLACHLRSVGGNGKSDREGFYASVLWLHRHHPKTLALNLLPIAGFGYLKDLPEILHRLVAGDDVREKAKAARGRRASGWFCFPRFGGRNSRSRPTKKVGTKQERRAARIARGKILSEQAAEIRRNKRADTAIRAVERYSRDPDYRFLHDRVADVFAELLAADLRHLSADNLTNISLAAKWCPSLDSSYDRSILLCEAVARRLFPKSCDPVYSSLADSHYAYRVRDRLR